MESDPKFTVFILGITNSLLFLRLYIFSRSLKISFIKGGFILFCVLNISVIRVCKFFVWIQAPRCDFESGGAKISKWGNMSDGTLRGYFVLK